MGLAAQEGDPLGPPRITARTNVEAIRVKAAYFSELGLWPENIVDPLGWLSNFETDEDVVFAAHLLNALLLYNDELLVHVLSDAVGSVAANVSGHVTWPDVQEAWSDALTRLQVLVLPSSNGVQHRHTHLERIAARIFEPFGTTAQRLDALPAFDPAAVVVLDDFMGHFSPDDTRTGLLRDLSARSGYPVALCIAFADADALTQLSSHLPGVRVSCAHVLPAKYSVSSPDSVVWPDALRSGAMAFLHRASARAGVDGTWIDGGDAIALSFSYRPTASTVPLFLEAPAPSWKPLLTWSPYV